MISSTAGRERSGAIFKRTGLRALWFSARIARSSFIERLFLLQVAQARRVRRADVEHDVISEFVQAPKRIKVILDGVFERSGFRFADVDADGDSRPAPARPQFRQTLRDDIGAVIVEAEAIDERLLHGITKDSRPRISRLRLRGDGADFDETETERFPRGERDAVLVEAGRETDWIRKVQAEDRRRFRRWLKCAQERPQRADGAGRRARDDARFRDRARKAVA